MMFWGGRPWVQMVLLSIWVILCGGGGLPASTYTQSGPQPQECGRSTFLPGEEDRYQHVGGGQDSVHLPHTDDWVFNSSRYDMRWSMKGFPCGRRTPGPSLHPAQWSPAQECRRSTFLPGSGNRCRRARGGREGHPPTRTKINKKFFFFFFPIYYFFFCIHIFIYIYNSRTQTYIHLVQVHPGDSPTPHHPSPRWVRTLHFPRRGKGCQGASTDPGRSLQTS